MTTLAAPLTPPKHTSSFLRAFAFCTSLCLSALAFATDVPKQSFNLPADSAEKSLRNFSQQSGLEVIFPTGVVQGVRTNPVSGEMSAMDALDAMLADTGLVVVQDRSTGAFSVRKETPAESKNVARAIASSDRPHLDSQEGVASVGTGAVSGRILDSSGIRAVRDAIVKLDGFDIRPTDALGDFSFSRVPSGTYRLLVTAAGYHDLQVAGVEVPSGNRLQIKALRMFRLGETANASPLREGVNERALALANYEVNVSPYTKNVDLGRTTNDALPYQIFTRSDIERLGVSNTTEFIARLTQNSAYENTLAGTASGDTQAGKSQINLRGLGISNTLVLLNGRRVASNLAFSAQGNVSNLPLAAVEQVEMLSSGASAIYGASAVGGVINFILRKDYDGTQLSLTYGNSVSTDAPNRQVSLLAGKNFNGGKSNVTLFFDYSDQGAMLSRDRGVAARIQERVLAAQPTLVSGFVLPPFSRQGNVRSLSGPLVPGLSSATIAGIPIGYDGTAGAGAFAGTLGRYNLDTDFFSIFPTGGSRGDMSTLLDETESGSIGVNFYHRASSLVNVFLEALYSEQEQKSPYFATTFGRVIPATNPHNPFGRPVFVSNVLLDFGEGEFRARNESMRAVAGMEGKIGTSWKYIADFTAELNSLISALGPQIAANTAIADHPLLGGSIAEAYNPFLDFRSGFRNPAAVVSRMATEAEYEYRQYLMQTAVRARGRIFEHTSRPTTIAVGAEHRREAQYDNEIVTRLIATDQVLSRTENGRGDEAREVLSAYAEAQLPVLGGGLERSLFRSLDIDVGARLEHFSDFGSTINPIAAVRTELLKGLLLRASWGTGFVAPALEQINYNNLVDFGTVTDRRRGNESAAVVVDGSLNRYVDPETSESVSFGLIYEPKRIPGLRVSVDWFMIAKRDNIINVTAQSVLDNESELPGLVVRGAAPAGDPFGIGPVLRVFQGNLNATRQDVKALDFTVEYAFTVAGGQFVLRANGTYTDEFLVQLSLNGAINDFTNRPLNRSNAPVRFRGAAGFDYVRGPSAFGFTTRYISRYRARSGFENIQGSLYVAPATECDVRWSYNFNDTASAGIVWLKNTKLSVGINNIFDREPPFAADANYYGYSRLSSPRQMNYYIKVTKEFAN